MTITDIIQNRRSVFPRSYDRTRDIPKEVILHILENANFAPMHKLTEPFRCDVLKGDIRQDLADFMIRDYLQYTPVEAQSEMKMQKISENPLFSNVVIVLKMKRHAHLIAEWEEIASVAMAVQNMWLTCSTLGIGAYWSTPDSMVLRGGNFIKLAEDEKCLGLFYMGYVQTEINLPVPKRSPMMDKIIWHG